MKISMRFYAYILCTYPSAKTNKEKCSRGLYITPRENIKEVVIAFKLHGKYTFNAMICYITTLKLYSALLGTLSIFFCFRQQCYK